MSVSIDYFFDSWFAFTNLTIILISIRLFYKHLRNEHDLGFQTVTFFMVVFFIINPILVGIYAKIDSGDPSLGFKVGFVTAAIHTVMLLIGGLTAQQLHAWRVKNQFTPKHSGVYHEKQESR